MRFGTLRPFLRASESPIAIACFGLVTFLPLRPLFSLPRFISRISVSTCLPALGEYLRPDEDFFEDDFFAVVGNSLSALQLSTRIGQAFGIEMKLAWLFTHRSVAAQAALVAGAAAPAPPTPALVRVPRGERHVL